MATKKQAKKSSAVETVKQVIYGRSEEVELSTGDTITVRVCNGKALGPVLEFMSTIAADLGISVSKSEEASAILQEKLSDMGYLLQLISKYTDCVFTVLTYVTPLSYEEVEALDIDDLLKVVISAAMVNKNFFTTVVLPMFATVMAGTTNMKK